MNLKGICCAGNFLVDKIYTIDEFPAENQLVSIQDETLGTGGGAYNCLIGLAKLKSSVPLYGIGLLGEDAMGESIKDNLSKHGVDIAGISVTKEEKTSYTLVLANGKSGNRTFLTNHGTNALLGPEHFDFSEKSFLTSCKILHIAYVLILRELDRFDDSGAPSVIKLLKEARKHGILCSIDTVTIPNVQRYRDTVIPCLEFCDYCIMNEIEAGNVCTMKLRDKSALDYQQVEACVKKLADYGVKRLVCIHYPEGCCAFDCQEKKIVWQASLDLSDDFLRHGGTAGAGDAFTAGMLFGLHEEWDIQSQCKFGCLMAANCLTSVTCTDGLRTLEETLDTDGRYGLKWR